MDFTETRGSGCNWLNTMSKGMELKLQFYHQLDTVTFITTATLLHKIQCSNLKRYVHVHAHPHTNICRNIHTHVMYLYCVCF
jgi:hypothetical protein